MRLHEMTTRTSNFDDLADNYAKTNANGWQTRVKTIGYIGICGRSTFHNH